jgi:hypothetical protein
MLNLKLLSGRRAQEIQRDTNISRKHRRPCKTKTTLWKWGIKAFVEYFPRKRMSSEELKKWTKLNFKPMIGPLQAP